MGLQLAVPLALRLWLPVKLAVVVGVWLAVKLGVRLEVALVLGGTNVPRMSRFTGANEAVVTILTVKRSSAREVCPSRLLKV